MLPHPRLKLSDVLLRPALTDSVKELLEVLDLEPT
jgi:hypothetical protein